MLSSSSKFAISILYYFISSSAMRYLLNAFAKLIQAIPHVTNNYWSHFFGYRESLTMLPTHSAFTNTKLYSSLVLLADSRCDKVVSL